MERLLDRVLSHTQFIGNLRLRRTIRFVSEQRFQAFEQNHIASGPVLVSELSQHLIQQRQRPAALVKLVSSQCIRRFETATLALLQLIQWNQPLAFTTPDSHSAVPLVRQKMFERGEQIGTQAPFLFADTFQIATLQQQCKETLSKIFRFLRLNALSPNEAINRSPISAAKFFERRLCCWCWTLRLQHHTPVSCSEGDRTILRA